MGRIIPKLVMFTLLRGGRLHDPEDRGTLDLLVCGETIAAIAPSIYSRGLPGPILVEELAGALVVPGFVDGHIHLVGGGGGEGYGSRLPEIWLSDLTRAGITTVVGAPGLDTASKSLET